MDIQEKFTQKRPYVPEVEEQEEHHEVQQEQITAKSTDSTDDSFDQIESLIEQVKIHIEGEGKSVIVNENFASELEQIIKSYPSLKYTPYKSAINELIITECGKYGLNTLDEEDVSKFWE
ncbi:hypothetical protein [Pedobacter sp.]|uniref:hypothetical protein n=1 Tax=Pedobacter sp. TaxID=1411316 RepID=UPI002D1AFB43|nr:hypothetical protein [Pedobacter sp.]HWW41378.1 hypothetical protein [Pedobacter sp.]